MIGFPVVTVAPVYYIHPPNQTSYSLAVGGEFLGVLQPFA